MITKSKIIYPVTLSEVKTHLRIDASTTTDDTYLTNSVIKSATKICENLIDKDLALTTNILTEYDFLDSQIRVNEGNIVTVENIISDSSTLITSYSLKKYSDHFIIEFDDFIDSDPLVIQFTTGFDVSSNLCPEELKNAIFIEAANLYDSERSSYNFGSLQKNNAIDRILGPHKSVRW